MNLSHLSLRILGLALLTTTVALVGCGGISEPPSVSSSSVISSSVSLSSRSSSTSSSSSSIISSSSLWFSSSSSSSSSAGILNNAKLVYAVNAGGQALTMAGVEYQADRFASGGNFNSTTGQISGATQPSVYQSERYGNITYEIPVTHASYSMKLHFAELFQTRAGARLFSVTVEGQPVLQNFDLFAEVGRETAYEVIVPPISVVDGFLTLELTTQIDNATLSGFAIFSNDGGEFGGTTSAGDGIPSAGCGKAPTLKSGDINLQGRSYALRLPDNYDQDHPYRLIFGLHGATGSSKEVAPSYFGLWALAQGSTIFIAPSAAGGFWNSATDVTFFDEILKQVKAGLCIDTSRIQLEGFSQGGAMAWALACARPGVYRAAVVHSGGGVARPASCAPVAFMSSLGQSESGGAGQTSNSDFFAKQNGCTVAALPKAPKGGHVCSDYKGCSDGHPTRWCDYDGGHTPSPTDSGKSTSWMSQEAWNFLKQF